MPKDPIDPDDSALFRASIGIVQPLKTSDRVIPQASKPKARFIPKTQLELTVSTAKHDDYHVSLTPLEDLLDRENSEAFTRAGVQHKTMKQLRRGKYPIGDRVDLHGATSVQAHRILHQFIANSLARDYRVVIVIHGKGRGSANDIPVLKTRVNHWLRNHADVMGFCPAAPQHGGGGALYVLLKSGQKK